MEVRTVKQLQRSQYIELAVVRDILQKLQDIESSSEGKVGEDIIEQKTKQLALAKILCKVYHKDQNLLIRAHCELGIAYLDMEYIEQAKDHLINAFQLNESASIEDTYSMKEYQLKIMVHLSKCYYDEKNYSIALEICEHTLKTNQKFFGENHLSNGDLYYMLGKVLIQLEKYTEANENFEKMKRLYNEHYGEDSEKVAKVYMEIARLYEIRKKNTKARKTYRKSYEIFEKIIEKEESKEENKKDSNNKNKNKKQNNSKSKSEHESNSSEASSLSSSSSISSDRSIIDIESVSSLGSGDEEEKTGHKKKKEKEKEESENKKKKEKKQEETHDIKELYQYLFNLSSKISELYELEHRSKKAYKFMCLTFDKYGEKANENMSYEKKLSFQKQKIERSKAKKDLKAFLKEHLELERILLEEGKQTKLLGGTYITIALTYLNLNDKEQCIDYFNKAEFVFRITGDKAMQEIIQQNKRKILNPPQIEKEEESREEQSYSSYSEQN